MTSTTEQQGTKTPTSSPHKIANPQQGMADPTTTSSTANNAAAVSDGVSTATAPTVSNTACTSPLTITSLEQATANGTAAANKANNNTINNNNANPAPTSGGVPTVVNQHNNMLAVPSVETMLSSGVSKLQLGDNNQIPSMPVPQAQLLPMMPVVLPSSSSSNNNDTAIANRNANAAERRTSLSTSPMLQKRTPPTEHDNRKLFVGGIPTDVSDEEFLHFFEQFGPIIDSVVMLDRVTKRSRGFGFVTFAHEEDADKLLTAVPGKSGYIMIRNKQVELKASTPKVDDGRDTYKNHPHAHRGGGGQGVWRSNPPTSPQQNDHYFVRRGSRVQYNNHHQPHVAQYSGDVDGRNFDNVSVQYTQDGQQMIRPIYQQQQNYMYGQGGGGYYYTPTSNNVSTAYPASSVGGQAVYDGQSYPSPNNTGYYDAYQYQGEYGNQQAMPQPPYQGGYSSYDENGNAYYAAEAAPAGDTVGGFDQSYNQSYVSGEGGEYEQQAAVETTEKYE